MKLTYLLPVFCFFTFFSYVELAVSPFKFTDCTKGKSVANITRFEVSPYPISLSKSITATADINLFEDVPPNTLLRTKIYKVTSMFGLKVDIPAPCIAGLGSCTTEHCKFLKRFEPQVCPFFPDGVECGCPLNAGHFGGENITVPIPKLGPLFKFLASGDFKMELQLITKEKYKEHIIACYSFTGSTRP